MNANAPNITGEASEATDRLRDHFDAFLAIVDELEGFAFANHAKEVAELVTASEVLYLSAVRGLRMVQAALGDDGDERADPSLEATRPTPVEGSLESLRALADLFEAALSERQDDEAMQLRVRHQAAAELARRHLSRAAGAPCSDETTR